MLTETVVWANPSNETRLLLSSDPGGGYLLQTQTRLVSDWESKQCAWLSHDQLVALYGVLAQQLSPGPEAAEDVPQPLQRLGTAALLIEAIEAAYWASALGGDMTSESAERRLNAVAGEINRRLYQYLQPSPWIRVGDTLYNVSQLRLVNRGMPELFDFLNRQAQQY